MHEDEDVQLMLAFQQGDYDAFGTLVERHQPRLIRYFLAQAQDRQLAEDCAQEVWRKIFLSRDSYQPRARFLTYLLRVARNLWIDVYRARSRNPRPLLTGGRGDDEAGGGWDLHDVDGRTPLDTLMLSEQGERIARAILLLPESMRDVFVLSELEDLPYQQIGEILDIPVGTVKSRMFHAVRKLREFLKKELNG